MDIEPLRKTSTCPPIVENKKPPLRVEKTSAHGVCPLLRFSCHSRFPSFFTFTLKDLPCGALKGEGTL
eukprot:scaffold287_cov173-Amphora_coffeaeformis.AAC.27